MKTSDLISVLKTSIADLEEKNDTEIAVSGFSFHLTQEETLDFAAGLLYLLSEEADGVERQVLECAANLLAAVVDLVEG